MKIDIANTFQPSNFEILRSKGLGKIISDSKISENITIGISKNYLVLIKNEGKYNVGTTESLTNLSECNYQFKKWVDKVKAEEKYEILDKNFRGTKKNYPLIFSSYASDVLLQ